MPDEQRIKARTSRAATLTLLISLAALLACLAAALFFLPLMGFIGIAIVAGGALFSLAFGMHYLIWGWWLPRLLRDESADDERS
jgi:predicted membrane-bound spermidine synthase